MPACEALFMPTVLSNFLNSEKGVAFLLVFLVAVAFTVFGVISPTSAQWLDNTTLWLGIYTGGKAIQGAASAISSRPLSAPSETMTVLTQTTAPPAPGPTPTPAPAPSGPR
jgi:hypothetical protein